ncbi:hypothetical protein [Labrys neptuniae]
MRYRLFAFPALAALAMLAAQPVLACAVAAETAVWARAYAAIVIAKVEDASYLGPAGSVAEEPAWRPWQAMARPSRSVTGKVDAATYNFARRPPFPICAVTGTLPLPGIGTEWVLYLQPDAGAGNALAVAEAFPLDFARRFDPRLGGQ